VISLDQTYLPRVWRTQPNPTQHTEQLKRQT